MKIKSIEAENFRNFKDKVFFEFPTDGRMSVVYGTNGAGKTTFHQLIQWIIYDKVNFNKTTTDIKYNLQAAHELRVGEALKVKGEIVFEHPNEEGTIEEFCIYRSQFYLKKTENTIIPTSGKFEITKKHIDIHGKGDWHKVSGNPIDVINKILPQGLSQYFFFDGETMIADIKEKGSASSKAIKKALYSIFDIDVYEHAEMHVGYRSSPSQGFPAGSLLSKLYGERVRNANDAKLIHLKADVNRAEKQFEVAKAQLEAQEKAIKRLQTEISELSEKIGSAKDCVVLNKTRKQKSDSILFFEESIRKEKLAFGKTVFDNYTYLFLSSVAKDAQNRIALKVDEEHLIAGVTKTLIDSLLKEELCLCGHSIGPAERETLSEYFSKLPPKSYKYMYDLFKNETVRWSKTYDPDILIKHLKSIFSYMELIENTRREIHDIDEELKISKQHAELIEERKKKELSLVTYSKNKSTYEIQVRVKENDLKKARNAYEEAVEGVEQNKEILLKIKVMEEVAKYFHEKVETVKVTYSEKLQKDIQHILNTTLNCERFVHMSSDFVFSVKDEYGKEDKSEGQFAMVSFAYICGIFKLLLEEDLLKNKQYPLVLDGPFSKLDVINRQNIINELPNYAPQVIIFSKDDLSNALNGSEEIWTLFPNENRNVTEVKKGYFPEVFVK